jgi:hypothetical protein
MVVSEAAYPGSIPGGRTSLEEAGILANQGVTAEIANRQRLFKRTLKCAKMHGNEAENHYKTITDCARSIGSNRLKRK